MPLADILTHLRRAHAASGYYLRWALLAWILVLVGSLALSTDATRDTVEPVYQMVSAAATLGLVAYGLLNVYFGVIEDFSGTEILKTTAALFVGLVLVTAAWEKLGPGWLLGSVLLFAAGMGLVLRWLYRQLAGQNKAVERPHDDATVRGGASVFHYGSDAYRLVERKSTGKNTPAEQFERRLIRYIERKLAIQPISMAGTNASYWNLRFPSGGRAEMVVLGPGYNTALKLHEGERWLLRIREAKPGYFTGWIARHFPEGAGVSRNLGTEVQTQFASHKLGDDKAFFDQEIEVPDAGIKHPALDDESALAIKRALMQGLMESSGNGMEEVALPSPAGKPTLH